MSYKVDGILRLGTRAVGDVSKKKKFKNKTENNKQQLGVRVFKMCFAPVSLDSALPPKKYSKQALQLASHRGVDAGPPISQPASIQWMNLERKSI